MRLQITPSQSCDVKKDIDVEADDVNSLLVAVGLAISVKVVEILIYDDDFEEWTDADVQALTLSGSSSMLYENVQVGETGTSRQSFQVCCRNEN